MKKIVMLVAAAALVATLAPGSSSAAHCPKAFLFSGVATGVAGDPTTGYDFRQGLNIGSFGNHCTHGQVGQESRFLTPGASHAWAGVSLVESPSAPTGTLTLTPGGTTTLVFKKNDTRGRWESQSVALNGATKAVLSTSVGSTTYTSAI